MKLIISLLVKILNKKIMYISIQYYKIYDNEEANQLVSILVKNVFNKKKLMNVMLI